jgi:2-(1,2-epoxy-1,2-dihydrophenyl)acetyl-CoA isomerase
MMETIEPLLYNKHEGWAEVTFNRPDHHNAMSPRMLDLLLLAVEAAVSDTDVRVLMLTGAGRSFCVGGDMDAFSDGALHEEVPESTQVGDLRRHMRVVQLLRESDLVTVAAVNGACAGAGLSIALSCDLRLASERSVFRAAFLDAGLSGDFGGTWLLTKLLGESLAKELYLMNSKVDPVAARELGLVARVLDADGFRESAIETVEELAAKAPVALRLMKSNLSQTDVSFSVACDREAERHIRSGRTEDAREAAMAFVEKRSPRFVGH